VITLPARGATGDDNAGAAARGAMNRGATSNGNALAAQLAQNEDGVPPAAMVAPPSNVPTPAETGRFGADIIESRVAAKQDDVAPVRHAIVASPEAAAARIETTVEALATRTARMPMHPAVAQVVVSVTKAAQEGVDRITIKLQPPELGRIDVRLEVGVDGRIQAVFAAERSATVEILQRDVRELERALQNAGLSTDAGSLSFGLKQNGGQNGGAFSAFERNLGNDLASTAEEETAPAARPKRAAIDGRLDIHV
jgi:flagellar hook-length control protein FliK